MNGPSTRVSRRRAAAPLFLIAPFFLFGCEDTGSGFCQHINDDPVLAITAASDSVSGEAIAALRLVELAVAADEEFEEYFTMTNPPAYNISREGSVYHCTVPCGFSSAVGRYSFGIVADGYQRRNVSVEADYEEFIPGCPSRSRGSTEISVTLVPTGG